MAPQARQARLKVATFSIRATVAQSARWKQAAEAEGFPSIGAWTGEALDAYLEARKQAGKPLPLFWSKGRFRVRLEDGTEPELAGWTARPFGIFRGNPSGPLYLGCHTYTLAYLPDRRIVATFRYARHCKALASELARLWVRWGGEPKEDPTALIERHRREST